VNYSVPLGHLIPPKLGHECFEFWPGLVLHGFKFLPPFINDIDQVSTLLSPTWIIAQAQRCPGSRSPKFASSMMRLVTEMGPVRAAKTVVRTFIVDIDCPQLGAVPTGGPPVSWK
jgi:hypothetical protein